ncbi:MAG: PEP-utilizing enzyme [Candidatus Dormibacteria bacterium]
MAGEETVAEMEFAAPGPGHWGLDPVHFPRPVTRYWMETHPAAFVTGTGDFARYYGMPMDGMETRYVNGFAYNQMRPVSPEEIPARFARADAVMRGKLWREQLREWEEERKPATIAEHRAIQAVDPDALSDQELAAHLRRCRDHHAAMMAQHMRYTASAIVPVGDFVVHAAQWTGRPPAELLGLMRGSARVSSGGSDQLEALIASLRRDPEALRLLQSDGDPAQILASLRELPSETGRAVAAYLDLVGFRPLDGFDISEPSALELPDPLLRAIRGAVADQDRTDDDLEQRVIEVRGTVPEDHRAEFDELLGEARLTYGLRDERGVYSDAWASGLMRRAALAAGRRAAARGQIQEAEHMVDATIEEMCSLLADSQGPSAGELAARARYRTSHSAKDAPTELGGPEPPHPDPSGLPPMAARLMQATGFAMGSLFGSAEVEHEEGRLRGLAASRGVYEGPARRVSGPSEFGRILKGDVLVTESTTEAFNILLPLLGAIVTDNGGLLSHSAIVAREYGIPGVVGTRDATDRISDGMQLRVDGNSGEVLLLR